MPHKNNKKNNDRVQIRLRVPKDLKYAVQRLADERNIALSALLRLVITEYVKRHQTP